jgi:phage terminase large subunit-like protein
MWCSPDLWKSNKHPVDLDVFRTAPIVAAGLDLSARNDLTACVLAARDDEGFVHVLPFVFTPSTGIEDRARRDRAPYVEWVKAGKLIPIGGSHMDYQQVATYMRDALDDLGINIDVICFDRWRIDLFKAAADEVGFAQDAEWSNVGQGFRDFSPRLETSMKVLLDRKMAHGSHPLLNMAVANAISVVDPAGSAKLDKSKSTQRIDPLVALVMAVHPVDEGAQAKTSSYLESAGAGILFI